MKRLIDHHADAVLDAVRLGNALSRSPCDCLRRNRQPPAEVRDARPRTRATIFGHSRHRAAFRERDVLATEPAMGYDADASPMVFARPELDNFMTFS